MSKTKTIETLPDSHFLALSKAFASKARKDDRRDAVGAGDDLTIAGALDYSFVMKVGKDNPDAVIAMSVPTWDILAAAIGRLNGVTIESLIREVVDGKVSVDLKATKKTVTDAFKAIKGEHRGLKKGPVKVVDLMIND